MAPKVVYLKFKYAFCFLFFSTRKFKIVFVVMTKRRDNLGDKRKRNSPCGRRPFLFGSGKMATVYDQYTLRDLILEPYSMIV